RGYYAPPHATFASGCHAAIVEVEIETGVVRFLEYVVQHDCGRIVNPMIVEGQIHGGVAQGIGGALYERLAYDSAGQPLARTFMDSTLTYGRPRVNRSGTLLEGIELWGELKPSLTHDEIRERALELCRWAVARGTLAIRSHVDVCDPSLRAVKALLEVRELVKGEIDLQLVAFPQDGFLRSAVGETGLTKALDLGVDVVGGIPHFERTMADGAASVERLCRIAAERGLLVDMHCDETDDPLSRNVEVLAREAIRHRLQG